jgi:ADP-ribose pyrophosphatase YjhB (NUDIX family)
VAIWHAGEVLVVRTSYRRLWDLPGGGIRLGETARAAALRELREEIGLALGADRLTCAFEHEALWEGRRDHVTIFEVALAAPPALAPDGREIVAAVFRRPGALPLAAMPPHVRAYLDWRRKPA